MKDCIFCKIIKAEIPTEIIYQDEQIIVFKDINPKAPVHLLIVPKKHLPSVNDLEEEDIQLIGKLVLVAKKMAKEQKVAKPGYRLIINSGPDSGQIVDHIHLHLLGGKSLRE